MSDFGTSRVVAAGGGHVSKEYEADDDVAAGGGGLGAVTHAAPEQLGGDEPGAISSSATTAADVFAFGVLLWEMYTGAAESWWSTQEQYTVSVHWCGTLVQYADALRRRPLSEKEVNSTRRFA